MEKVIISVLGPDRPGIIASISRILYEQDCNIENISQTILQSEFSGIFIVALPPNQTAERLHKDLNIELNPLDLQAFVRHLRPKTVAASVKEGQPFYPAWRSNSRPDTKSYKLIFHKNQV